jgi:predicted TIM-barrel fold metal-dependent hydrolase
MSSPTHRVIDCHTHPLVHPSQQLIEEEHTGDAYRARVAGSGIELAAALVMAPADDIARTRALNNGVLNLASTSDGFFFPVCSAHPFDGELAMRELERVRERGARWIKLHPNTQRFDVADPRVTDLVTKCAELGMPVLFDGYSPWDPGQPGKFVQLAMAVPSARLILAHAHGPQFPSLLVYEALARYPWWNRRVWIDISVMGPLYAESPFAEQFTWVLRKVGLDRVLFGSDYPMDQPETAVAQVRRLGFSEEELALIFYENARRLLDEE